MGRHGAILNSGRAPRCRCSGQGGGTPVPTPTTPHEHAAPNAILPVITFLGISIGQLTGGAVVTETIFSMPGTGRLFVASIEARDFPVMLAIGMLIVVGVVMMNLLADIGYEVVNPQIRHRS